MIRLLHGIRTDAGMEIAEACWTTQSKKKVAEGPEMPSKDLFRMSCDGYTNRGRSPQSKSGEALATANVSSFPNAFTVANSQLFQALVVPDSQSFQQDPAVALITGKGKKLFLFPLWRALFKDLQWEIPSKLQEIKLWREKLAARSSDGGEGG